LSKVPFASVRIIAHVTSSAECSCTVYTRAWKRKFISLSVQDTAGSTAHALFWYTAA